LSCALRLLAIRSLCANAPWNAPFGPNVQQRVWRAGARSGSRRRGFLCALLRVRRQPRFVPEFCAPLRTRDVNRASGVSWQFKTTRRFRHLCQRLPRNWRITWRASDADLMSCPSSRYSEVASSPNETRSRRNSRSMRMVITQGASTVSTRPSRVLRAAPAQVSSDRIKGKRS
jgi:hypothetical protein